MRTVDMQGRPYLERDISWMKFNQRLLFEAEREDTPLMERFKFLGIHSNNLDEFFRVRIASLRRLLDPISKVSREEKEKTNKTLQEIDLLYREQSLAFERIFGNLVDTLSQHNIHIINEKELSPEQEEEVRTFYMNKISGSANPIFLKSPKFNPEIHLREAIYLLIILHKDLQGLDKPQYAIVEIPSEEYGRFISLKQEGDHQYLMFLDDILRYSCPYIFAGLDYKRYSAYTFKITKDAEMDMDSDLRQSVMEQIYIGVKRRRRGAAIRLVYDRTMPAFALKVLASSLKLKHLETALASGSYHNMKDLMSLPKFNKKNFYYPSFPPLIGSELSYSSSIIEQISKRDIGIHFPYESFDQFLRVLREAAINPEVKEIKVSLYRVAQNSKVVYALMSAAKNGKRVQAVVELLARFDERSNIKWSKRMQEAGVEVVFGHKNLKIHSKLLLIKLTNNRRIACIGTGNLHEGTAKLYTDYMLLTAHKGITNDVDNVFRFIEYPYLNIEFKDLLVAPNELRNKFNQLIDTEIANAQAGKPAYVKMKLNHIVDPQIVLKLYEAVEAGVEVSACLRGNCSLVPNERTEGKLFLNAIIDHYLEHSRIFIFANGGKPRYFLGSSDLMTRNLDRRIEVLSPIYDKKIQEELELIVELGLRDKVNGYYINEHSGNPRRYQEAITPEDLSSQTQLYQYYQKLHK